MEVVFEMLFLPPIQTWVCKELVLRSYIMQRSCFLAVIQKVKLLIEDFENTCLGSISYHFSALEFAVTVVDQVYDYTIGWKDLH